MSILVGSEAFREYLGTGTPAATNFLRGDGSWQTLSGYSRNNNILLNHDGMINQRLLATNADDTYGLDRWNILTQTGAIAASQITNAADGTPYMMRHTQSQASAQRIGTSQIVESFNAIRLRGKTITIGVKHKISSNGNIRVAVLEWTGTADSVTSDVVNDWTSSTYTAGNFFLASNLTVTSVSSSVASTSTLATEVLTCSLGSSLNNLIIFVWSEGTVAQNVTLDLVIDGQIGTFTSSLYPFPYRTYEEELSACQRYLPALNSTSTHAPVAYGSITSTSTAILGFVFKVTPRTVPTGITYSDVAHFNLSELGITTSIVTVLSIGSGSFSSSNLSVTGTGTPYTVGRVGYVFMNNASGQLLFEGCEL